MVFAYTIDYRIPLLPMEPRENKGGRAVKIGGTYTNGAGDSGGVIATGADEVLHASASTSTGILGIQLAFSAGNITITTTINYDGTWEATILYKSK